jgi:hypothetical protein
VSEPSCAGIDARDPGHGDHSERHRLVPPGVPSLNAAWLRGAIEDLIDGGPVALAETERVGCSIKWRL